MSALINQDRGKLLKMLAAMWRQKFFCLVMPLWPVIVTVSLFTETIFSFF